MSGIEVVGLILGAVPLIISGMEHYADGVSTLGRYRKYRLELKTLINILETEKAKLTNTCDKLLVGLAPPWKIEAMIEEPFGEIWSDKEIQRKIQVRLWRSFGVFETTVKDVHAAIQEMVARLGLQPDGRVKWVEGNSILRELKRATFSLSKASYEDLLARIKDGVASLDTLTAQNVELEPKRKMRSRGRLLTLLREISKSIYRALNGSLGCTESHHLNLELATQSADYTPNDEDERITKELAFQIAISGHPKMDSADPSREQIYLWEEIILKETTIINPTNAKLSSSSNSGKLNKGKSVNFSWQSTTATNNTGALTVAQHPNKNNSVILAPAMAGLTVGAIPNNPEKPALLPVNLCKTIHRSGKSVMQSCYGYIADIHNKQRREYGVYPVEETAKIQEWSAVSLRQVLERSPEHLPPMTYHDRLYLAVVISSSLLQLHETPWLPDIVRSENIVFIQRENMPLYQHAFVTRRVPEDSRVATGQPTKMSAIGQNLAVFSLGKLLIELILGKSLRNTSKESPGTPETDFMTDYIATQKLLGEVDQWGGINYGSAVRRCLNYHCHRRNLSLEDEEFRHDVYSNVVAPLEQDLREIAA